MAAVATKTSKKKFALKSHGRMPSKRSINLAFLGEEKINLLIAIPAILLILVAAALFSKFFVIDRIAEVNAAQAHVASLRTRLNADYAELADYDDISELYAHYTYSGMTAEELQRTDRVEILSLLRRVIVPRATVSSFSLSGNVMTVGITSSSLQEINLLAQALGEEEIVDFCTVSSAVEDNRYVITPEGVREVNDVNEVTARVIVYFKPEVETKE